MPAAMKKSPPPPRLPEFELPGEPRPLMAKLYREAKSRLRRRPAASAPKKHPAKSGTEDRRLVHELQVHQVELEMQNHELQEGRERLETLLEKFTDLYDFAPVGYFSLDESGRILEANLTAAAFLGVGRALLINRRLTSLITVAGRPAFQSFLQQVFAGVKDQTCEMLLVKAAGGLLGASFRATSAVSLSEDRKWCRVAFMDVSDRMAAEAALRASEKRYRTLFELVPLGVYSCDATGLVRHFNRRATELWGRTPVAGDPADRFCGAFKLFQPDGTFIPKEKCPMADVLSGRVPVVQDEEVIVQQPDGTRLSVIVNIRPLKQEQGEITGAINCFYDITERKLAEAAQRRVEVLAASNQKLEREIIQRQTVEESLRQSEQHQKQLLARSELLQEQLRHLSREVIQVQEEERKEISRELHDVIAQTLTGINLRLATIKKTAGQSNRGMERSLSLTQRLVEKSVAIVHRFARELRPAALDDLGLIPALHSALKVFSARTGVHAHLKAFAGVEQLDMARRTVLFRVAQEALTNVSRHAQAARVEIHLQPLPGGVGLSIHDDGKSFVVDRTLRANGGKRLGLLGMRERVEMVGGTFGIESAPGRGTTVQVQIPFAPARKIPVKKSVKARSKSS
jgi:signal transduction histidine kinase